MSYQTKDTFKSIFNIQIFINAFIILGFGIQQKETGYFILAIFNLLGLLIYDSSNRKKLVKFNRFIQIIVQTFIIPLVISYLIRSTIYNWNSGLIYIILIYGIVMYIPYSIVLIGEIKTSIMRLLITPLLFIFNGVSSFDIMTMNTNVANNQLIKVLSNSSFLGALTFSTIILTAMLAWGYNLPKINLLTKNNWKLSVLIFIFSTWFIVWNALSNGSNWLNLLTSYNFSANFTLENVLGGLEAGIAEELTFRFTCLTILISIFKRNTFKNYYAVFFSSLMFGLIHLPNVSSGQSLGNTLIQIIFAFALGTFLSALYLYTNNFLLPVIFHSLMDILVFASSNSQIMIGKVTSGDYLFTIVESLIFISIALLLLRKAHSKNELHFYF
ncbi:CAAX family membrane-bound protease [Companilactobacillus tucceti DSM 20183]|uniref:CAAX family membrane-bound protease n=1 Tax=Companilactobacillus tucceti DSM 20183 TaxID=1423811 RepID=A0A0R1J7V7_9LACO|nr:CPBP family intramembrane glutamic endopeptidase [Companilactobacillus tucceti]KRK64212.1 CAAX family membrane-bound protease [Companilactobacillus tucceti DSM 20183]